LEMFSGGILAPGMDAGEQNEKRQEEGPLAASSPE